MSSNLNVTRTPMGPEAQADGAFWDEDVLASRFNNIDPALRPSKGLRRDEIFAYGLVGGVGWLVLLLVFGVLSWATGPAESYETPSGWNVLFSFAFGATVLSPVVFGVWGFAQKLTITRRNAQVMQARAALTRDRWMNPINAEQLDAVNAIGYFQLWQAAEENDRATAPYRQYRGVEAFSPSFNNNKGDAPQVAGLLADNGEAPLAPEVWLPKLVDSYHLLLAAETGGGKSTMARAIIAERVKAGDEVFVIDPHFQPGNWFDLPGVGGGRNYREVQAALEVVLAEMNSRYERYNAGEKEFRRLTVLVDEVPAIFAQLDKAWSRFSTNLGSEARKVNVSLVLITQSPLLKDNGINSTAMRRNFRAVALDAACIRQLVENVEFDRNRREALLRGIAGAQFPAAVELDGVVHLLDRSNVVEVAAPLGSAEAAWETGYSALGSGSFDGSFENDTLLEELLAAPARTNERTNGRDDKLDKLRALRAAGVSRDRAREMGLAFTDTDWTEAGR